MNAKEEKATLKGVGEEYFGISQEGENIIFKGRRKNTVSGMIYRIQTVSKPKTEI
jgi:hypothetical protein